MSLDMEDGREMEPWRIVGHRWIRGAPGRGGVWFQAGEAARPLAASVGNQRGLGWAECGGDRQGGVWSLEEGMQGGCIGRMMILF